LVKVEEVAKVAAADGEKEEAEEEKAKEEKEKAEVG